MAEILAPVGGAEQLIAAVRSGADAVYLGAGGFNARQSAENFGEGRLREAVSYCHVRGVAVHVTVNTLVMDQELPALDETIEEIAAAGTDAVIVQDLAVYGRFRDRCPSLPRHASTQMTIHDLEGAKLAADMGFSRVVLSRELTLKEIERITSRCGIETEVFIHGALCMCMSGACYLSSMLGGRSGNRGYCAQPCRLAFKNRERDHALSLKDMSHISYIRELADLGVASFKIEGRMKRPEYVAAAVTACRKALAGEPYDEESLRAVFSRSGFTDGYLTGKRDAALFGTRRHEDVTAAGSVLKSLPQLYKAERQSVPVELRFRAEPSRSLLTATDGEHTVSVAGETPQIAKTRPLDAGRARESLSKTGGTPYFVSRFEAEIGDGLTLPASALNALRREALEKLTEKRAEPRPIEIKEPEERKITPYEAKRTALYGHFRRAEQLTGEEALSRIILPVRELERRPDLFEKFGEKLMGELPALSFDGDGNDLEERLGKLRDAGLRDVLCENLYGVGLGKRLGFHVHGGAGLNVMNTLCLEELEKLGLESATVSFELAMSRIRALGGTLPRGLVAYGRLPLMRFRACPARPAAGCGSCTGVTALTDPRGVTFPLLCEERRFGTLLNSVPLHIGDKTLANVDFLTLRFTLETPDEVTGIIEDFRDHRKFAGERTGGLYYRGIK